MRFGEDVKITPRKILAVGQAIGGKILVVWDVDLEDPTGLERSSALPQKVLDGLQMLDSILAIDVVGLIIFREKPRFSEVRDHFLGEIQCVRVQPTGTQQGGGSNG